MKLQWIPVLGLWRCRLPLVSGLRIYFHYNIFPPETIKSLNYVIWDKVVARKTETYVRLKKKIEEDNNADQSVLMF